MTEIPSLTYKEKVLIHLKGFYKIKNEETLPQDLTQEGISNSIGMSRTHVSRVVRKLIDKDFVEERKSNIKGRKRKLKAYCLTQEGFTQAKKLLEELSKVDIQIQQKGEKTQLPLTDIPDLSNRNMTILDALDKLEQEDESLDFDEESPLNPVKKFDSYPEIDNLYGRDEEFEKLEKWLKSSVPVLVLLGRKGYGTSSLTSKFVENIDDRHLLWINIADNSGKESLDKIKRFYEDICNPSEDLLQDIKNKKCMLIFDDYYDVPDKIVDFLSELIKVLEKSDNIKLLLNTREGTPVYERFYQKKDLENGKVEEMTISPLNKEDAQKLLGSKLEDESLRRIMQFTKGSPLLLKLLKEGNREKLEEVSYLGKEQISLLMFLKSKTK